MLFAFMINLIAVVSVLRHLHKEMVMAMHDVIGSSQRQAWHKCATLPLLSFLNVTTHNMSRPDGKDNMSLHTTAVCGCSLLQQHVYAHRRRRRRQ